MGEMHASQDGVVNMESISLLNLVKYAKVFLIIAAAVSITAVADLIAASGKSLNCTTFLANLQLR